MTPILAAALLLFPIAADHPPAEPPTVAEQAQQTHPGARARLMEEVAERQQREYERTRHLPAQRVAADRGRARLAAQRAAEAAAEAARVELARQEAIAAAAREAAARAWVLPVADYRLTARFGQAGARWSSRHTGLDFAAPSGTKVRAIHGGEVIETGWDAAYGNFVVVQHWRGCVTTYNHLSRIDVYSGPVDAGQLIGRVGTTGNSTGPHLHLEVRLDSRAVDPYDFLASKGRTP